MQQIHEDKNKPTGKEIQVILTKVTWPYCSEENGQKNKSKNKNVHLTASVCSRWLNRTRINPNKSNVRPGLINDSHSFNRSRCMVQIVAEAEGTVVLRSRTAVSFWDFVWNQVRYLPTSRPPWWDALMPWRPRELWRECPNVCDPSAWPWVLHFHTSVTKVLWLCAHVATR